MAETLRHNIDADSAENFIAVWHDESHMNRYFVDHPTLMLSRLYAYPQDARGHGGGRSSS